MIHPRIDDLLQNVDSRYALVIVAAKRARQINNYHHQLGEGTFDEFPPPLPDLRADLGGRLGLLFELLQPGFQLVDRALER